MKIKLKIGVDIDEVIVNQLEQVIAFYYSKTGKYVPLDNFFSYNWWEVWGVSKDEAIKIDKDFKASSYFENLSLIEGAREAILKLSLSHEVFFITSRSLLFKDKTENFIKKNFPNNQFEIIFSSDFHIENPGKTKSDLCKELNLNFLIEDNSEYALQSAKEGIKVFLLNKPWNKGVSHKNLFRVKDWGEILEKIK